MNLLFNEIFFRCANKVAGQGGDKDFSFSLRLCFHPAGAIKKLPPLRGAAAIFGFVTPAAWRLIEVVTL
jgi:hypothetical protein